jgi:hypothetical protein
MTREENSKRNAELKYQKARKAVLSVTTGMFNEEYKKDDGSWNISKIADAVKLHRDTVRKHLRIWEGTPKKGVQKKLF